MPETALVKLRPVAQLYADFLAREGLEPTLLDGSEDGETTGLFFHTRDDDPFLLFAHEDDPDCFRVGIQIPFGPGPDDHALFAEVANDLNHDLACVKMYLDFENRGVRFMVDFFLAGQPITRAHVERASASIRGAMDRFRHELRRRERRLDA